MHRPPYPLSESVLRFLSESGWREDQNSKLQVDSWEGHLQAEFTLFPAARRALERFAALRVVQSGPGEEQARESFEIDPTLAQGEVELFQQFEGRLSTRLYPLGEAGGGHVFLAIAETGRVYALRDYLWMLGETIEDAIENLVRGRHVPKVS